MHNRIAVLVFSLLLSTALAAQTRPAPPATAVPAQLAAASAPTDRDVAATQHQLLQLLRLSPKLTTVVAHDPSLLADQDYVSRNNPQLADFLKVHPEVSRNPDFYLFTHMAAEARDGSPDEALERAVWPEFSNSYHRTGFDELLSDMAPILGFACFLAALVWVIRLFGESRRWNRIFKIQSDVHNRIIDKFGSSQELAAYMETEAGRRFLEAAPIPLSAPAEKRFPNAVARVLTPVQIGVVLVLLGIGFLLVRHAGPDYETPMLVLGVLITMPGIGFIISAAITWVLASRLGLMPAGPAPANDLDAPNTGQERR